MSPEVIRALWLIVVITTAIFIYLGYVIVSFYFMRQFKRKITNALSSINVLIYQKYETLDESSHFLISEGYENPKLIAVNRYMRTKKSCFKANFFHIRQRLKIFDSFKGYLV